MATKPPPTIETFPSESLEAIAYAIVADIETEEPNDRNRLGYHVWSWLKEGSGTLKQAIQTSGSRTTLSYDKIFSIISKRLQEKGIKVS